MDLPKEFDEPNENRYWEYSHEELNNFINSISRTSYQNDDPFVNNMDYIPLEKVNQTKLF